jgi:hypothetical protein
MYAYGYGGTDVKRRLQSPNISARGADAVAPNTELREYVEAATRNQASPLDGKPLVVLSTSNSMPGYAELQRQLVSLSSNSKELSAGDSGHYIMIDRPDLVISAIRDVVKAAKNHSKLSE